MDEALLNLIIWILTLGRKMALAQDGLHTRKKNMVEMV